MRTRNMNRRKFLKNAAMGGAGLALPANFGPVLRLLEALERVDLALTQASPSQIT
ncbi:MAG TPA: twin-arginine translocation signal domain-containing protein [Syntrophales bacterium]|nr:twin-arginine translocation signal domain-containing protein [Syntrophales bacterium]